MPGNDMPKVTGIVSFDKLAHFSIFSVQVLLLIVSFQKQYSFGFFRENSIPMAIGIGIVYGVCIEIAQSLIPERSFEFLDIIADSSGCFAGYLFFYMLYKYDY